MPMIRPSADLRNNYAEISDVCHASSEPVFITKNGKGDLVVMSIENYEQMQARLELYSIIDEGLQAEQAGIVMPLEKAIADIRKKLNL